MEKSKPSIKRTLSISGMFCQYYTNQPSVSPLNREKSKSMQKLTAISPTTPDVESARLRERPNIRCMLRKETQGIKDAIKKEAENVKDAVSNIKVPETWTHKKLIQKLLPADFSPKVGYRKEDFNEVLIPVYVHVYRLKESDIGFYHTGIEIHGREYTFCCDRGIVKHEPRNCDWGEFLGTIMLGEVSLTHTQVEEMLTDMKKTGFACTDYDVMKKSCNTFTEAFSGRLGLLENFPTAVHNQTKLGQILAPVVKALDFAAEKSGNSNAEGVTVLEPDSGHASLSPAHSFTAITTKMSSNRSSRRTSLFLEVPLEVNTTQSSPPRGPIASLVSTSSSLSPSASLSLSTADKYKQFN